MEIDESDLSGSEFQLDEDSAQEEIMLDAAVRMSLQTAAQNGAGPSSGRVTGSKSVAVKYAAAAERRLATGMRAMTDAKDDEDMSDLSDISSEEVEPSSKGKGKTKKVVPRAPKGPMGALTWATWEAANVTISFTEWKAKQKNLRKGLLAARRANKAEERAMIKKLGRRLTHVSRFFVHPLHGYRD